MKKRIYGIVLGMILLAVSGRVADAAMPYVSVTGGLAMLSSVERNYDSGYALAGAAGLDSGKYRFEAEVGYQNNALRNSAADISMTTWMANGYYDLEFPLAPVKPFVAAGLGVAQFNDHNGAGATVSDSVFAWHVGAGAGFSVAPLVTLDAQYRYFAASDPRLTGNNNYSIGSHNVLLGLRIGF